MRLTHNSNSELVLDPNFRYDVISEPRSPAYTQEDVEHLREVLREKQARRRSELEDIIPPRERSRDRIQDLESAIEQLEGIMRQQRLTPKEIESIQKSLDNLRYQLDRYNNSGPCE